MLLFVHVVLLFSFNPFFFFLEIVLLKVLEYYYSTNQNI